MSHMTTHHGAKLIVVRKFRERIDDLVLPHMAHHRAALLRFELGLPKPNLFAYYPLQCYSLTSVYIGSEERAFRGRRTSSRHRPRDLTRLRLVPHLSIKE